MAALLAVLRPVIAIILALLVCLGFLLFVVERTVSGKLLNDRFYAKVLDEQGVYDRFYDEVLLDDQVREFLEENLLAGQDIVTHDELIGLVEDILPPESMQGHVERLLSQAADYINEDSRELELYVDLSPDLERVKPALLAFVEERIDRVPVIREGESGCSPGRVADLAQAYVDRATSIRNGKVPGSIPSLESLSRRCRELISGLAYEDLIKFSGLEPRVVQGLTDRSEEIRSAFVEGDTHTAVKSVVIPMVSPLIDDTITEVREELDDQGRLELVGRLEKHSGEEAANVLRDGIRDLRRWVLRGTRLARNLGWPFLFGGSVLLVLVYLPRVSTGLRWLGGTLIVAGGIGLIAAKLIQSAVPDRVRSLVDTIAGEVEGFPASLAELISDVAAAFVGQLAGGAAGLTLIALLAGVAVFAASFLSRAIRR